MRRYGLYDATRGLTTALAAGVAGLLLWCATQVGVQGVSRFWESMAIVAAAGLVLALSQGIGGWTKGGRVRISPTTFLLAFLPVLVCVGWILMATQPGSGWHEGRIVAWSQSVGISSLVHSLGLWHGVLAFGLGLVLGMSFDTIQAPAARPVHETVRDDETMVSDDRGPADRQRPGTVDDADEPTLAEQRAAAQAEPRTTTVGPRRDVEE